MAKVLLIYPSQFNASNWGAVYPLRPPLVSLWSHLRSAGHQVHYLDLDYRVGRPSHGAPASVETFRAEARRLIASYEFDVVGISAWSTVNYLAAVEVARICRELRPSCRIAVGGYHAKAVPGDFTGPDSPFDDVVVGEGEYLFERICRGEVPRARGPQTLQGEDFRLGEDAFVEWEAFPDSESACGTFAFLQLSRGCPFSCSFCLDAGGRWRPYEVERALEAVRRCHDSLRPGVILFWEPIFGVNRAWRRRLLEGLIRLDLDVLYATMMRLDVIEKEDVELLSRLNFQVDFGFETGSARMLERIEKTASPARYLERTRDILAEMGRRKVLNTVYVMYNNPGDDAESDRESHEFLSRLLPDAPASHLSARKYCHFPGSDDHSRQAHFEKTFGTRFLCPDWWRIPEGDHFDMACAVVPSAADWKDQSWLSRGAKWHELSQAYRDRLDPEVRERSFSVFYHKRLVPSTRWVRDLSAPAGAARPAEAVVEGPL